MPSGSRVSTSAPPVRPGTPAAPTARGGPTRCGRRSPATRRWRTHRTASRPARFRDRRILPRAASARVMAGAARPADTGTAASIRDDVRSGRRSAVEVCRQHLDRIADGDGRWNAFTTVFRGRGARPRGRDRQAPGRVARPAPARRADHHQGRHLHAGTANDRRLADPGRVSSALRRHRGRPPPRGRRDRRRQDQLRRVRDGIVDRALRLRTESESLGPRTHARGVERRRRRRGRGRARAGRHRIGHGRLHPPAGGVLRDRRTEADLRPRLALRTAGLRLLARPDRPAGPDRGRRGSRAGSAGGTRSARRNVRGRAGRRLHGGAHRRRRRIAGRRAARVAGARRCGHRRRGAGRLSPRARRARRSGRLSGRRRTAARGVRGAGLLPGRPGGSQLQPRPLRRGSATVPAPRRTGAATVPARRSRRCTTGRATPGFGGGSEAPHHARNLRVERRVLRRVLPAGTARPKSDSTRLRPRLRRRRSRRGRRRDADHTGPRGSVSASTCRIRWRCIWGTCSR